MKHLVLAVSCAVGMAAATAMATTIDSSDCFALVNPGNPASPANDTKELNDVLSNYYPQGTGNYSTVTTPDWGSGNRVYSIHINDIGELHGPATFATGSSAFGTSFTIDLGAYSYDYLMVKWANVDVFYNVRGLEGSLELVNDLVKNRRGNAQGASGYKLFNATKVPDGGASLAMLGLGIIGLGLIRRRAS